MSTEKNTSKPVFLFGKKNYLFMFIGLAFIALGFIFMAGGGSNDPTIFNEAMYDFQTNSFSTYLSYYWIGNRNLCHTPKP